LHIFFMDIVRLELMSRYLHGIMPFRYLLHTLNYISAFYLPCSSFSLLHTSAQFRHLCYIIKPTLVYTKTKNKTNKMKYSAAVLAFAGSALAAGGADAVNAVLTEIASDLKDFDTTIKAYTGGSADAMSAASQKIEKATSAGAATIAGGAELSLTDAVGITSNVQSLQTTLDATLSDLKSIGDKLVSSGQCSTILEQLNSQGKSAQALQDAITSKAPAETKAVAQQLGGAIGASIAETNGFFTKACANAPAAPAGGSSGSSGSSSSAPSSGSSGSSSSSSSSGSSGSAPAGGAAPAPAGGHGGAAAGGHGDMGGSPTKPNKAPKTSGAVQKPATYAGAAATMTAPFVGAFALALAAFAL
jgi:hypothetical protein